MSGVGLLIVAALLLWQFGPLLPALGAAPIAASALLAASAIGLGHWVGGPDEDTRITSAIVCALRNPGIALLVASANGMPAIGNDAPDDQTDAPASRRLPWLRNAMSIR